MSNNLSHSYTTMLLARSTITIFCNRMRNSEAGIRQLPPGSVRLKTNYAPKGHSRSNGLRCPISPVLVITKLVQQTVKTSFVCSSTTWMGLNLSGPSTLICMIDVQRTVLSCTQDNLLSSLSIGTSRCSPDCPDRD